MKEVIFLKVSQEIYMVILNFVSTSQLHKIDNKKSTLYKLQVTNKKTKIKLKKYKECLAALAGGWKKRACSAHLAPTPPVTWQSSVESESR